MPRETLVPLGVVVRPHGIRGELRVKLFNPSSDLLYHQSEVILRSSTMRKAARIEKVHPHQPGLFIVQIAGYESRTEADLLRGVEICIYREALPELEDGEVYHIDLIDLEVVTQQGECIGTIREVIAYPTSDALRVVSAEGNLEIEIPMLTPYVTRLEFETGRVLVDRLEDLEWRRTRKPKKRS